ncbi:DUF3386 domain-containing protein [Cylindrospermum sp. FACHB-282]|uniref:DUF3386 domain-containing protein n=1 Tax=Cylindrospermum sp. FACHB-282 TaxID=2692794 RepID=UPI00168A0D88|nr:DUF3386 domain-containing protein [Cylindrospermum sp. FACHB-282]MBD2384103.1 DUF3386 domain-containing protein [Cylindrospermum sp. FACHB-282]
MTVQTTAGVLFQTAYESRYTWDENFPGYSADVQLLQGDEVYTGKIRINHDLSVKVTDVRDAEVEEGIYIQLQEMVTHCKRSDFQQSYGKFEFILGEIDKSGVVEILVQGDSINSHYKIRDQEICQEIRVMGRMALVINTHENFNTGAGYIASRYDAVFRDSKSNQVNSVLKFADTYQKVGDYYIMTKQVVQEYQECANDTPAQEALSITEFNYSNIKLLEPVTV